MYTDICDITNITIDEQFGEQTKSTQTGVDCRVEQEDIVNNGGNGSFTKYSRIIFLRPGTLISKGDSIKITKERGVSVNYPAAKAEEVFNVGGYGPHHVEVYIK